MSEFQTVLCALNEGFVATLKLFAVTLIGSIPLGLIICFGSMNRWAPLRFLQNKGNPRWLNAVWGLRPISAICRLVVWIVRGTPLVLQLIALFYVPGMVGWFNWPGGTSRTPREQRGIWIRSTAPVNTFWVSLTIFWKWPAWSMAKYSWNTAGLT